MGNKGWGKINRSERELVEYRVVECYRKIRMDTTRKKQPNLRIGEL